MNMGKKITDLAEGSKIPGESRYLVSMGDGTGEKQVKHKTLVEQLLDDMAMPYDETLAMLTGTDEEGEENGKQKIPNLQAVIDWIKSRIVNSLLATEEGFFLDATQGKVLGDDLYDQMALYIIVNPQSENEVAEKLFEIFSGNPKLHSINFYLYKDQTTGLDIPSGKYFGEIVYRDGDVSGILISAQGVSYRLNISGWILGNPRTVTISSFIDVPNLPAKIDQINSDLKKTEIGITPGADRGIISPYHFHVYEENGVVFIYMHWFTSKFLEANHEYDLGTMNYTGLDSAMDIALPVILTTETKNAFYLACLYISGKNKSIVLKTPSFTENNVNHISVSGFVKL